MVAVAAVIALPFAIPALATADDAQVGGEDALAQEPQSVNVSTTAGSAQLDAQRADLYPTTRSEALALLDDLAAVGEAVEPTEVTQDPASTSAPDIEGLDDSATPEPVEVPSPPADGVGSLVAAAAVEEFGVQQDCAELVTTALAAADIPYSGMGNLFNLGPTVTQDAATAGDVVYYADGGHGTAHVAIYLGDGSAVHGGWSDGATVIASVELDGSEPVFIHLG